MSTDLLNLDALAAQYGNAITEAVHEKTAKKSDTENWINKSLGVLQEQGVYAFFLFLDAQRNEATKALSAQAASLLGDEKVGLLSDAIDRLQTVRETLVQDLDDLLLAHTLLHQALIYARYHARALSEPSREKGA